MFNFFTKIIDIFFKFLRYTIEEINEWWDNNVEGVLKEKIEPYLDSVENFIEVFKKLSVIKVEDTPGNHIGIQPKLVGLKTRIS